METNIIFSRKKKGERRKWYAASASFALTVPDSSTWHLIEFYVKIVKFTHGLCQEWAKEYYLDLNFYDDWMVSWIVIRRLNIHWSALLRIPEIYCKAQIVYNWGGFWRIASTGWLSDSNVIHKAMATSLLNRWKHCSGTDKLDWSCIF